MPRKKRARPLHLQILGNPKEFKLNGIKYEATIDGLPYTVYLVPSGNHKIVEVKPTDETKQE